MLNLAIRPFDPPPGAARLRRELQDWLASNMPPARPADRTNCWAVIDVGFSRKLAAAGYVGMTLPKRWGGHERHPFERYIVLEELLVAGAPVGAHWIADRQTGPLILRYGTDEQRGRYLPGMARGEIYSCIGLSEPGAGSDLASIRTSARRVARGWVINGQKLWTSNAHVSQVMLALVRTEPGSQRDAGLSQFLVDMASPGITVKPILDLVGMHHFNEVFFDDVAVPDSALIGTEGEGWQQATAELALERSGPERYLSSHVLLSAFIDFAGPNPDPQITSVIGRLTAELWTLRQMSTSVAAGLAAGDDVSTAAAMVKDLGNVYEQTLPVLIDAVLADVDHAQAGTMVEMLVTLLQTSPCFSLRGGTREIMRGIIARGLGLR